MAFKETYMPQKMKRISDVFIFQAQFTLIRKPHFVRSLSSDDKETLAY